MGGAPDSAVLSALSLCVLFLAWIWKLFCWVWWRPMKLQRSLNRQGIHGRPYKMLFGNLKEMADSTKEARSRPMNLTHCIVPRLLPFLNQTVVTYGKLSITWFGVYPRVTVMDPEMIRDILLNKFGHFAKPRTNPLVKQLAKGVANYEGEKWAKHRRVLNPAFHQEKLKSMMPAFFSSCSELVSKWEKVIVPGESHEIDVWPELQNLTADAISRTAFGSSYKEGMRIFQLQSEQAELVIKAAQSIYFPGLRFLPTKDNIRRKEISSEVGNLVRRMVEKRLKAMEMGETISHDLLGLMIESSRKESEEQGNSKHMMITIEDVIDECKLFYFAGQETTSVLLTWTMVVLSMNPSWQQRAREEVLQLFGENKPTYDGLNHLKIVTMILNEVLRLYPPGIVLVRSACKETKLGGFTFPSGVQFGLPILLIHHDTELWGEDANEFKPERFSEGVGKASKHQLAFFPFGWGPRICIGQNFAFLEAKLALAMILQSFSFELSPSYTHAPTSVITLQPQHGAQLIIRRLSS